MLSNKRAPLIAGIVGAALAILLVLVLVLPELGKVSTAQTDLDAAAAQQTTLESELRALQDAQATAPQAQQTIDQVNQQIPPTADLPGAINLLQNAATSSGIALLTITPSTPTFDPATGLSTISISIGASGTYFTLTEYIYKIETLPRAAKMLNVSLAPQGSGSLLSMTATLDMFTSDTSAGPGSTPGSQGAGGPTGSTGSSSSPGA